MVWSQDAAFPHRCPSSPSSEVGQCDGPGLTQPLGPGTDNPLLVPPMCSAQGSGQAVRLLPSGEPCDAGEAVGAPLPHVDCSGPAAWRIKGTFPTHTPLVNPPGLTALHSHQNAGSPLTPGAGRLGAGHREPVPSGCRLGGAGVVCRSDRAQALCYIEQRPPQP